MTFGLKNYYTILNKIFEQKDLKFLNIAKIDGFTPSEWWKREYKKDYLELMDK